MYKTMIIKCRVNFSEIYVATYLPCTPQLASYYCVSLTVINCTDYIEYVIF